MARALRLVSGEPVAAAYRPKKPCELPRPHSNLGGHSRDPVSQSRRFDPPAVLYKPFDLWSQSDFRRFGALGSPSDNLKLRESYRPVKPERWFVFAP